MESDTATLASCHPFPLPGLAQDDPVVRPVAGLAIVVRPVAGWLVQLVRPSAAWLNAPASLVLSQSQTAATSLLSRKPSSTPSWCSHSRPSDKVACPPGPHAQNCLANLQLRQSDPEASS